MKQIHIFLPIGYFGVYFGGAPSLLLFLSVSLLFVLFHDQHKSVLLSLFSLAGFFARFRDATLHFTGFSFHSDLRERLAHYIVAHNGNNILLSLATGHRFFSESFRQALADSGSYHLIAISAMHIGVVMGIILFISQGIIIFIEKPSLQWAVSRLFVYSGTAWYLVVTGGSLPTIRAALFFVFADLLFSGGVAVHPLFLLLLSLVATSFVVPGSVITVSFVLSAISVGGVLLLIPKLPRSYTLKLVIISFVLQFLLAPILADMNGYFVMQSPLIALLTIPLLGLSVPAIFMLQFSLLFPFEWLHSVSFFLANFVTQLLQETIVHAHDFSSHFLVPITSFPLWSKIGVSVTFLLLLYLRNYKAKLFVLLVLFSFVTVSSLSFFPVQRPRVIWRKKLRMMCVGDIPFAGTISVVTGGYRGWSYRANLSMKELSLAASRCGFLRVDRVVLRRGISFHEKKELKKRVRFSHCRLFDISHDVTGIANRCAVTHRDNPLTALLE